MRNARRQNEYNCIAFVAREFAYIYLFQCNKYVINQLIDFHSPSDVLFVHIYLTI